MAQRLVSTVAIKGSVSGAATMSALDAVLDLTASLNLLTTTPAANCIFADSRALAAGASDLLDLSGSLVDIYGRPADFGAVNLIFVSADAANAGDLVIGGDPDEPFNGPLSAGGKLKVAPNGSMVLSTSDADAWIVASSSLRISNPTGFPAGYRIFLIGPPAGDADGVLDFSDPGNPLLAVI